MLGVLKLIRLLRLGRIITYMKVNASLKIGFRIFQLLMGLIVLVHWLSCIWYILVSNEEENWIPTKDLDAYETNFYSLTTLNKYSIVFYYSILLIVGNDCAPVTFGQTVYASLVMIIGAIVTAFIFGNMAALMATINKKDSYFQEQLDMVSQTMRSLKLPEDLQDNVLKYLQYIHETPDVQQDLDKFLALLSPSIKNQILYHQHSAVVKRIEILKQCSSIEISFIVNHLKTLLFLPNDVVIRQGEDSFALYFINRGQIEITLQKKQINKAFQEKFIIKNKQKSEKKKGEDDDDQDNQLDRGICEIDEGLDINEHPINTVQEGDYFGEIGLITNLKRTATATSVDFSTISMLSKKVLNIA